MVFLLVNLSYNLSRLAKPDFDNARKFVFFEARPGAGMDLRNMSIRAAMRRYRFLGALRSSAFQRQATGLGLGKLRAFIAHADGVNPQGNGHAGFGQRLLFDVQAERSEIVDGRHGKGLRRVRSRSGASNVRVDRLLKTFEKIFKTTRRTATNIASWLNHAQFAPGYDIRLRRAHASDPGPVAAPEPPAAGRHLSARRRAVGRRFRRWTGRDQRCADMVPLQLRIGLLVAYAATHGTGIRYAVVIGPGRKSRAAP